MCTPTKHKAVLRLYGMPRGDGFTMPYASTYNGLSEYLGITRQRTVAVVGGLMSKGLVEKHYAHPMRDGKAGRKVCCFALTPKGREVARMIQEV